MAEAFGIFAGAVNIAQAFTTCVDCFGYIQMGRHFGRDFQTSLLTLRLLGIRLSRWGAAVQIYDDPKLGDPQATEHELAVAKDTIFQILVLFSESEKKSKKFRLKASPGVDLAAYPITDFQLASLDNKMRALAAKRQKGTSLLGKLSWACYEKESFSMLIEGITTLVDLLENLFPAPEAEAKLADQEIKEVEDHAMLQCLQDLATKVDIVLKSKATEAMTIHASGTVSFEGSQIGSQIINGDVNVHIQNVFNTTRRSTTFGSKTRNAILNWLSPLAFNRTHMRIKEKASLQDQATESLSGDSTGNWLLEDDAFDDWRSRKLPYLWYYGMPGAGKTVLASIIIDHMLELEKSLKPSRSNGKVTYMYLEYEDAQSLEHLLGSIVRQIVQDEDPLPEPVVTAYSTHHKRDNEAPSQCLSKLLFELSTQQPVYIIVDALDECSGPIRKRLLKLLKPKTNDDTYRPINILITSRLLDEFSDLSEDFHRVNITANPRDINMFVEHEFRNNGRLKRFAEQDRELLSDVKFTIRQRCNGMFLLASLHMKSLTEQYLLAEVREKLKRLPNGVDGTYDHTLERIRKQPEEQRALAWKTLAWVVLSKRRLTAIELQHALACVSGTRRFDPERIYQEDDIRDVCLGLVTLSHGLVTLVHYTAQTYLTLRAGSLFAGFDAKIAQTCARYLGLKVLEQPDNFQAGISYADDLYSDLPHLKTFDLHKNYNSPHDNPSNVRDTYQTSSSGSQKRLTYSTKCQEFPFVKYAARYLGHHLRQIPATQNPEPIMDLIVPLLEERPKRNFICRMFHELGLLTNIYKLKFYDVDDDFSTSDLSGSLSSDHDSGSDDGTDPSEMTYYVEMLFESILEKLETDRDAGAVDGQSGSSESGNETTPPDSPDHRAVELAPYTPKTMKPEPEITPVHLAALLGWEPLVMKLATGSPSINAVDQYGQTPISLASELAYFDVVEALLNLGATIDLTTSEGLAIMFYLAESNQRSIIRNIISHAFDLRVEHHQTNKLEFLSCLFHFLIYVALVLPKYFPLVERLVSNNFYHLDLNTRKEPTSSLNGGNPKGSFSSHLELLVAAESGDVDTISSLSHDGKIDLKMESSRFHAAALFLAVAFNQLRAAEALIEGGVDVNTRGLEGRTVLHLAASRKSPDMVRMLLSKGASTQIRDSSGFTAWSGNVDNDYPELMDLLIKAGTDLNSVNAEGMSTLYQSAAGGHIDIVRFLLNSGANPSIQTMFGWAPLHWAAANGHLACVRALLTAGADLNPMSDTSKTPFDMATSSGQEEIAHILRQAGAKTAEEVLEATATKNQSDTFTSQKSLDNGEDETNSNVSSSEDDEFRFVSMLTAAVNSLEGWSFPSMHIKKKVAVFLDRDLDEVMRDLDIEEFVTDEDRNTWKASLEQAKMTEGISALLKDSVGLEGSVGERKDVEDGNVAM